jgi:two-component system phosphate regulon sensor histidine kinase PhoR
LKPASHRADEANVAMTANEVAALKRLRAKSDESKSAADRRVHTYRRATLPEVLGLSLVGLFLVGMALVGVGGVIGHGHLRRQAERQQAESVARQIARLSGWDGNALPAMARWVVTNPPLMSCQVVSADRTILAEAYAPDMEERASGIAPPDADRLAHGETVCQQIDDMLYLTIPLRGVDDAPAGYVRVGVAQRGFFGDLASLWRWLLAGLVLPLLGFLVVYRLVHRTLRPTLAVGQSLLIHHAGVESQLAALQLADSMGAVAQAWNYLLHGVQELNEAVERVKAQQALTEVASSVDAAISAEAFEAVPDGLITADADGHVTQMNCPARTLLRVDGDSPVGRSAAEVSGNAQINETLERLFRANAPSSQSTLLTLEEGGVPTTLSFSVHPLQADDPEAGRLLVVRDVSQQRAADRARSDFLAHVAHELRTPLTSIRAYSETLLEGILEDPQQQRDCFNVIGSEARRLSRLIDEVLSISQLEVGSIHLKRGDVDLARLIRESVKDIQGAADEKNIELRLRLPIKLPTVQGDKERLAVALNNLLGNAVKYTPSAGSVNVSCVQRDSTVEIEVTDTGVGIAPAEQEKVFEKFYRAQSDEVQAQRGSGLGLTTAREIARLHGGEISLRSEVGKGSTFVLVLPIGRSSSDSDASQT